MISKNLFWVSLKENNKRRLWVWVVSMLFWFFYYPVGMALIMSRIKTDNWYMNLAPEVLKRDLTRVAGDWLAMNGTAIIFVSIIAIICAIQGFSYLYSRKKVDMYHSVPVKKSKRFAVIYINGILIYIVPYVINLVLAMLVAAVNGGMNGSNVEKAVVYGVVNLILYLGTYGLVTIAVMLTGSVVITIFATVIFLVYELAVRFLIVEYQSQFFEYFSFHSDNFKMLLSPGEVYVRIIYLMYDSSGVTGQVLAKIGPEILQGILLAAVFGAAAYFCYKKRPSEAAGKTMAFPKTKQVIKFLLVLPFTLGVGLVINDIVGVGAVSRSNNVALLVFGLVAALILSNCLIEVIYELDIKAAFRKKTQILISGICVAAIYCFFQFDISGYDKWIPDADKLDSAVVWLYNGSYRMNYIDENMNYLPTAEYLFKQQGITDVEAICELSRKKGKGEDGEGVVWCSVEYRMKNGKSVWREFLVSTKEEAILNRIMENQQYKESAYQIYDDELFERIEKEGNCAITYNSGIRRENLSPQDLSVIRELYLKDLENMNYTTLRDEFMCGTLVFEVGKDAKNISHISYEIYPTYHNIIGYLKEKGVYKETAVEPENIASITVTNYHNEKYDNEVFRNGYYETSISTDMSVTKTYTDEKQIKELWNALYPSSLDSNWKQPGVISDNYSISVQLKNAVFDSAYFRGDNSFYFIEERIPDWVVLETAYE